jgi:hypothetical protein
MQSAPARDELDSLFFADLPAQCGKPSAYQEDLFKEFIVEV